MRCNLTLTEAHAFYGRLGVGPAKTQVSFQKRNSEDFSELGVQRRKPPAVLSVRFFQKSEESGFPTVPLKVNGVAIK